MEVLIVAALIIGGFFLSRQGKADPRGGVSHDYSDVSDFTGEPLPNPYGLPDVHPVNQGGDLSRLYDDAFFAAAKGSGVPFALLKAQAFRESKLNPYAYRTEAATATRPVSASYGLMQPLWWKGSNRLKFAGYPDSELGDGSILYDPYVNAKVGAAFLKDALDRMELRDAINSYNTGVEERVRQAPHHYVDDVLSSYQTLTGRSILT